MTLTEENGMPKETTLTKVIGHPISTSILNPDNDLLRTYSHSKRVGNYLLGRTLGEGSFAKVKEALHALTTTKVAVKVIDKKKATKDSYVRKNLRREGRILQTVRHTNVAHLYEIMETDNYYYLVLELCEGGDLMERIYRVKRLDESEVRKYMRQIISAVDYLHKAGIIHRDLKIENLLLSETFDVKIIDFGLSNIVKVSQSTSLENRPKECLCQTQCGSPAYAAPELLANKKYGPEVDIWSIGVNMYAMLTGTLPFTVSPFNIQSLQNKMLRGEMNPIPEHLSQNCRDLLLRLLAPNPSKRITLAQAMTHPWIKNGKNGGLLAPSKFPNKMRSTDLDGTILSHIADKLKFRTTEVSQIVVNNTPHPYLATYMLLKNKLDKWRAKSTEKNLEPTAPLPPKMARPNKTQPFKRRPAQNALDAPSPDEAPTETKPQSPKRVAIVRPTEKVPEPITRKNSDLKSAKPVLAVAPARRCESVVVSYRNDSPEKDIVTDVMSPRPSEVHVTTATQDVAPTTCTFVTTDEVEKLKINLTKPLDMRQKTEPNLLKNTNSPRTESKARVAVAPVRLLGQGPYVIKSNPKPELPSSDKHIDYEEWRKAVMRRNVVDNSKYDSFARTNAKQPMSLPTSDIYDVTKFERSRPSLLKPNDKPINGYVNNAMMRMLSKRSTQPNIVMYDTKDDSVIGYKSFIPQSTNPSDQMMTERPNTSLALPVALPSICPRTQKKKPP